MELIGPYLVACALLLIAGLMKLFRPDSTARALAPMVPNRLRRPLQFRFLRPLIRIAALAEAIIGAVGIFVPGPVLAVLVAVSYGVFAGVVVYVRSQGGALASCGCFGTPDTPATRLHVVINVGLALSAVAVAIDAPGGGSIITVLGGQPLYGIPLLAASALCIWLAYLAFSSWAQLHAARRLAGSATGRWR